MAMDKEFSFDEDGGDFSLEPENIPKPKKSAGGGGGGGQKRLLLLVLLLVVAGAGAYFYLYGGLSPAPEAPPAPKVAVKPAAQPVPVKPAPPAASQPVAAQPAQPATAQPVAVKPAQPAAAQPVAAQPAQPAAAQPVAVKPAQPAAAQPVAVKPAQPAAAQPVAVKPAQPAAAQPVAVKPVAVKPVAVKPVAVKPAQPVAAQPAVPAKFRLSAGAYMVKSNLVATEKKLRQLGYEPQRTSVKRPVEMTRLRVGRFPSQEAAARLADLQPKYPEAFTIRQGEKVALYVGSFQNINRARTFADKLFLDDGIHVDEERVTVKVPMTIVHFGAFAERSEAEAAAKQARAAGLDDISVGATR